MLRRDTACQGNLDVQLSRQLCGCRAAGCGSSPPTGDDAWYAHARSYTAAKWGSLVKALVG